jgi:hypothetical protein
VLVLPVTPVVALTPPLLGALRLGAQAKATQVCVLVVSQPGVLPLHWLLLVQAKQAPLPSQKGSVVFLLLHCASAPQATQACVLVVSQIGVVPPHCASAVQAKQAPPVPGVMSQKGVLAFLVEQSRLLAQATQACGEVALQIGVAPPHCVLAVQALVNTKLAAPGASGVVAVTVYVPADAFEVAVTAARPVDVLVVTVRQVFAVATLQAVPPLSTTLAPLVGALKVTTTEGKSPLLSCTIACSEANAVLKATVCPLPENEAIESPPSLVSMKLTGVNDPVVAVTA